MALFVVFIKRAWDISRDCQFIFIGNFGKDLYLRKGYFYLDRFSTTLLTWMFISILVPSYYHDPTITQCCPKDGV